MKRMAVVLTSVFLLASPGATHLSAQSWIGDLRLTGAVPTQDLAGADLETGVGFGATLAYRVQPHLFVYGGWDWLHLTADQSFAGSERDFEETGYTMGLRFEHPSIMTNLLYRVEAGATYKHVEIEASNGDLIEDSGHELGFEAGVGLVLTLSDAWRLTPSLRYRSFSPDFEIESTTTEGRMRYAAFDVGVSYAF
jgi:opacity protein-like surface antigen